MANKFEDYLLDTIKYTLIDCSAEDIRPYFYTYGEGQLALSDPPIIMEILNNLGERLGDKVQYKVNQYLMNWMKGHISSLNGMLRAWYSVQGEGSGDNTTLNVFFDKFWQKEKCNFRVGLIESIADLKGK